MVVNRLLTNICCNDLDMSKTFYTQLFGFELAYDSDWFVQLQSGTSGLELGLIAREHQIVAAQVNGGVSGVYITFVVDDVDALYTRAKHYGCDIQQAPENTFYGQRRMLLVAPEGTVCDVSSPIAGE